MSIVLETATILNGHKWTSGYSYRHRELLVQLDHDNPKYRKAGYCSQIIFLDGGEELVLKHQSMSLHKLQLFVALPSVAPYKIVFNPEIWLNPLQITLLDPTMPIINPIGTALPNALNLTALPSVALLSNATPVAVKIAEVAPDVLGRRIRNTGANTIYIGNNADVSYVNYFQAIPAGQAFEFGFSYAGEIWAITDRNKASSVVVVEAH